MNLFYKLATRIPNSGNYFFSGALILGLIQIPFLSTASPVLSVTKKDALQTIAEIKSPTIELANTFFGELASRLETLELIEKKMEFVSTRGAFPASLKVIKKHEKTIREKAREYGVPEDVAIGVGLLENGGSETAKSPAGALGVFQLMPGTAKSLGLAVTSKLDERRDPVKNIDAGMRYLALNYYRFGDWGLATWAYHAGEGNVSKAVQLYAKANHGVTLPGVNDPAKIRAYVEKNDITIHKLLSSKAVKTLTTKLKDDSSGYPYKVIATSELFREATTAKADQQQAYLKAQSIVGNK